MIYSWWYGSTLANILTSISNFISSAGYTAIFGFVFALGLIFSLLAYLVNAGKHIDYFSIAKVYLVSFIIYGFAVTSMRTYTVYDECTGVQTSVNAPFIIGFPLEVVTSIEESLRINLAKYLPLPADMKQNGGCFSGYQILKPAVVYNIIEPYTRESMIEYMKDCAFPSIEAGDISMDSLYNSNPKSNLWSNVACNSGMLCASLDTYYYSGNDATFYSQPGHQSGMQVTCPSAYSDISADLAKQITNNNPNYYLGYTAVAMQALGTANLSNTVNDIPNWLQDESGVLMANSYAASDLLTQAVAIQEFANASAQFGEGLAYSETYLSNLAKIEALSFGAGGSLESTKGLLEIFFAGSAPIFILLWLTPLGRASFLAFLQMLIWIPTWSVASEVVAAILELTVGGNQKFDLTIAQISNMTTIFNKVAQQAIFMNHLVPLLTFSLATGSVYAITKVATAAGEMMMAGSRQGAELMTTGNLSASNQQLDTLNALNSSVGNMQYDVFSMYGSSIGNSSLYNTQVDNTQAHNISSNNQAYGVYTNTPIVTPSGQKFDVTGTYKEKAPGVYTGTSPIEIATPNGLVTVKPYEGSFEFSVDKKGNLIVEQGELVTPIKTPDGQGYATVLFSNGKAVKVEEEVANGKIYSKSIDLPAKNFAMNLNSKNPSDFVKDLQVLTREFTSLGLGGKLKQDGQILTLQDGVQVVEGKNGFYYLNGAFKFPTQSNFDEKLAQIAAREKALSNSVSNTLTSGVNQQVTDGSGYKGFSAILQGFNQDQGNKQQQTNSTEILEKWVEEGKYGIRSKLGLGVGLNVGPVKAGGGVDVYGDLSKSRASGNVNSSQNSNTKYNGNRLYYEVLSQFANFIQHLDQNMKYTDSSHQIQNTLKSIDDVKHLYETSKDFRSNYDVLATKAIISMANDKVREALAENPNMTQQEQEALFSKYVHKYELLAKETPDEVPKSQLAEWQAFNNKFYSKIEKEWAQFKKESPINNQVQQRQNEEKKKVNVPNPPPAK